MSKEDLRSEPETGVLQELAATDVRLTTLLLDGGECFRTFTHFLKSASGWFNCVPKDGTFRSKHAIAFMLQGIVIAFVVFTLGQVIPTPISTFTSTQLILAFGSAQSANQFVDRVDKVQRVLPVELRDAWRERAELLLVVRVLPEDKYRALLNRIATLASSDPALLRLAIRDPFAPHHRSGGRAYVVGFFLGLNEVVGPTLLRVNQVAKTGTYQQLRPHVGSIVRHLVLWYFGCLAVIWLLRWAGVDTSSKAVFWMGAYVIGFFAPLIEICRTLLQCYLSVTLVPYIKGASMLMSSGSLTDIGEASGGIFPFENLTLMVLQMGFAVALFLLAARAMSISLQSGFMVAPGRAWISAAIGIGFGLAVTEGITALVTLILAPTGLI